MAMLADRKSKTRYVLNPKKKPLWTTDSRGIKFGMELMEKMGWSAGKGLGANEQGISEPLRVSYKSDKKGMGFKGNEENWIEYQDEFNSFLNQLSDLNADKNFTKKENNGLMSLEEKSKLSRARVHYQKFTRGKDLSKYSENDLSCILGTSRMKNSKSEERVEKETPADSNPYQNSFGVTTINAGSITDYFKKKRNINNLKCDDSNAEKCQSDGFREKDEFGGGEKLKKRRRESSEESLKDKSENEDGENVRKEIKKHKRKRKKLDLDEGEGDENSRNCEELQSRVFNDVSEEIPEKKKKKKKRKSEESLDEEHVDVKVGDEMEEYPGKSKNKKRKRKKEREENVGVDQTNQVNGNIVEEEESQVEPSKEEPTKKRKKERKKEKEKVAENTDNNETHIGGILEGEESKNNSEDVVEQETTKKKKKKKKREKDEVKSDCEKQTEPEKSIIDNEVMIEKKSSKKKKKERKIEEREGNNYDEGDGISQPGDGIQSKKKKKKKEKRDAEEFEVDSKNTDEHSVREGLDGDGVKKKKKKKRVAEENVGEQLNADPLEVEPSNEVDDEKSVEKMKKKREIEKEINVEITPVKKKKKKKKENREMEFEVEEVKKKNKKNKKEKKENDGEKSNNEPIENERNERKKSKSRLESIDPSKSGEKEIGDDNEEEEKKEKKNGGTTEALDSSINTYKTDLFQMEKPFSDELEKYPMEKAVNLICNAEIEWFKGSNLGSIPGYANNKIIKIHVES